MKAQYSVVVNYRPLNVFQNITEQALPKAVRRVVDIGTRAGKASYLKQRKAGGASAIISSFTDDIKGIDKHTYLGVVQAGGPSAPHAVWVNFGHKLRNGQWWEGYDFMGSGGRAPPGARAAMEEVAMDIIKSEINKALSTGKTNSYGKSIVF